MHHRHSGPKSPVAVVAIACSLALGTQARAFSLISEPITGDPAVDLLQAARWADGFGLEDGIQVGVQAGLIESFAITPPTAQEKTLFEGGILQSFAAWENAALHFDITLDAAVTRDPDTGFEIDVMGLPASDPVWNGNVGAAWTSWQWTSRTLANGVVAEGYVITGADIYLNYEAMKTIGAGLGLPLQDALDSFIRLMIHEVGHSIGLHHPDQVTNYDTDFDPLNPMPLDPAEPYSALRYSPYFDATALMVPRPCPGTVVFCEFTTETQPHFDDIAGRDALYPVPEPEPAGLRIAGLLAGGLGARRRRAVCSHRPRR